jgi:hypothetical protein
VLLIGEEYLPALFRLLEHNNWTTREWNIVGCQIFFSTLIEQNLLIISM